MMKQCSRDGSNPLVCAVHNVKLIQSELAIDMYAPSLGRITCHVCPATRAVVSDAVKFRGTKPNVIFQPSYR